MSYVEARRSVLWLADLDVHAFLGDLSGDTWDVDLSDRAPRSATKVRSLVITRVSRLRFAEIKEAVPARVGKSSTSPSDAITLRNPLKIAARRSLSAISTLPEPEPMRLGATAKFDQVGWAR